jgi:uncharacterized membrane protein HdeD (DUF308 family)
VGEELGPSHLGGGVSDESASVSEAVSAAARYWWISVLRGCLAVLLGIGALASRAAQETTLVNFIAVYWVLGGLLTIKWAHGIRWRTGSRLGLTAGALAIVTGLALLARHSLEDFLSVRSLIDLVAVTTTATGVLRLVGAFEIRERTGHRWTVGGVLLGSIEICIGVVLLLVRDPRSSMLRVTIGIWGLVAGTLLLIQGVRMLLIRRTARSL